MKICNKCNIEKPSDEFYNKHSRCKECTKIHYQENKDKILKQTNDYYHKNIDNARKKRREYYYDNQDELRTKMNIWKVENKDHLRELNKSWYEKNKDVISKKRREIYIKDPEKKKKLNDYRNKKSSTDVLFKLRSNISSLIFASLKSKGVKKNTKTMQILGCSIKEFRIHLESKFESWMSWSNHGKYNGELDFGWDMDHIVPVSSAIDENEVYLLNHYTNLQPLCSRINRDIKKSKLDFNCKKEIGL